MSWNNLGDVSPRHGALMIRNPEIDRNGNFSAEAIETISETSVGGDEKRVLIRQGSLFLAQKNFASAFDVVGASVKDGAVSRPDANGDVESFAFTSENGLRELSLASHAYGGIDEVDIEALIQIGENEITDLDRKFDGDITVYPYGTSLWAIMERELDGFDYPHGKPAAEPLTEEESPGM